MCPMSNVIVSFANIFNIICPLCVDVSCGNLSYVLFPQTLDIPFWCGKKLHACYFTLKKKFQQRFQRVVILLLRTSTVDD